MGGSGERRKGWGRVWVDPREGGGGDPWKPEGNSSCGLNQFHTCIWDMRCCPWKAQSMGAAWFWAEVLAQSLLPPSLGLGFLQTALGSRSRHCPHQGGSPQRPRQEAAFPRRVPAPSPRPNILAFPAHDNTGALQGPGPGGCPGEGALETPFPSRNTLLTSLGQLPSLAPLVSWGPRGSFFGSGLQL